MVFHLEIRQKLIEKIKMTVMIDDLSRVEIVQVLRRFEISETGIQNENVDSQFFLFNLFQRA